MSGPVCSAAGRRRRLSAKGKRRAERVIAFIEKLRVPSGVGEGEPFHLLPFERLFIRDVYGVVEARTGRRLCRNAVLSIARKNGKTALIAALVLVHLIGPEAIRNGEIYSVANDRDQAAQVYRYASQIVEMTPGLMGRIEPLGSTKTLVCAGNGSFYRAVSSKTASKHGYNPSLAIYDEFAQAKTRELYDVFDTAQGARVEPLMLVISTQSADPQHPLSQMIDDGVATDDPRNVVHLYAVPDEADPFDEKVWKQANPALGAFRSLEDMRAKAELARRMPSREATFRNLYLNMRADIVTSVIPKREWMACMAAETIRPGEEIYLGLDLSATTDLTALVAVSAEDGDRLWPWFWKPRDLLAEHSRRDRVDYVDMERQGMLEASPGRTVQYDFVARRLGALAQQYKIKGLAYDRWRVDVLLADFQRAGIDAWVEGKDKVLAGGLRLVPWGQGFRDMGPAIDGLEVAVLERSLQHPGNFLLNRCVANAIAIADPAGNRKFDKAKPTMRIDGAVAAAMAIGLKRRDSEKGPGPSVYRKRGMLVM